MRRPISLVRSVTLTNMMFMMPMPAIRSENPAAMPKMSVTVSMVDDMVCIISACERMVKSSESPDLSLILWFCRRMAEISSVAASESSSVSAEQMMEEK